MGPLEELRARHAAVVDELRALHDAVGDGEMTEEQTAEWETLDAEERTLREESIPAAERRQRVHESRERWRSAQFGRKETPDFDVDVRTLSPASARSKAMAAIERHETVTDGQRERAEGIVRSVTGDCNGLHVAQRMLLTERDAYRSAFAKLMTRSRPILTPEEAQALQAFDEWRAMSIGTDSEGGYAVPVLIDPTIVLTAQGHPNDIIGLARVETITNDVWRGLSSAGMTWKFRPERTATTDGSPTLAQPTVPVHRADGFIRYSIEAEMDVPGFMAQMGAILESGFAELVVEKTTKGSGSDEPTGILTALDANTNVEVSLTTAATVSAGDINGLWASLPIRYRNPANANRQAWMMHSGFAGDIQQLGQDRGAAFTVDFTAEGVTRLKGRQLYENDYFADLPAGTTAANLAVIGDWQHFLIALRAGMTVEPVPHVIDVTNNMPTGERGIFAWARLGSDSVNDGAFKLLQNKTS